MPRPRISDAEHDARRKDARDPHQCEGPVEGWCFNCYHMRDLKVYRDAKWKPEPKGDAAMGLNITAYSGLAEVGPKSVNHDYDYHNLAEFYSNRGFPGAESPLDCSKQYKFAGKFSFRAGSYSGYNEWRAHLCRFAFECEPETVWSDWLNYEGKPFARLINFADNEGVIGSDAATKLAADFERFEYAYRDRATEHWQMVCYLNWKKAFQLAANDGAVAFH